MTRVQITYINESHRSDHSGFRDGGILIFDFRSNDGRCIRFYVMPDYCAMLAHRPWPTIPTAEWVIHLVTAERKPGEEDAWEIVDKEIDVLVEPGLDAYRMIDLEDFGEALKEKSITLTQAHYLLNRLQTFLDEFLHTDGAFPPPPVQQVMDRNGENR